MVEKILRVRSLPLPRPPFLAQKLLELERLAIEGKSNAVIDLLCEVVPTMQPSHAVQAVGSNGRNDGPDGPRSYCSKSGRGA